MFTEITWAMYLRVTAGGLFVYYTLLIAKSYLPKIKGMLSEGGLQLNPHTPSSNNGQYAKGGVMAVSENFTPKGEFNEPGINDYEIIEELVERVKDTLKVAAMADSAIDQQSLTASIQVIINDYPLLYKSTFRPSINEFIATESQQHGVLFLTEDTVEGLWRNV